jgi:hypothetical protein
MKNLLNSSGLHFTWYGTALKLQLRNYVFTFRKQYLQYLNGVLIELSNVKIKNKYVLEIRIVIQNLDSDLGRQKTHDKKEEQKTNFVSKRCIFLVGCSLNASITAWSTIKMCKSLVPKNADPDPDSPKPMFR